MAVKIVADSAADLPPELVRELGITLVPLVVLFGQAQYRDGVDIGADTFYSMLDKSEIMPTTSAPSVADFQNVYQRLLDESHAIVSIHIPAQLSGTVNSARAAREACGSPERIVVIDSQAVSLGAGMVAIAAARAANAGADLEEVVLIAQEAIPRLHMLFSLDTLEYLRRGGRIGRAQAFLGSLLNVKPILMVQEGEIRPYARERTRRGALECIFKALSACQDATDLGVVYTTARDEAEVLCRRLASVFPNASAYVSRLSPVLGAHTGPGALGVGLLEGNKTYSEGS